jgi:hypothetical protein
MGPGSPIVGNDVQKGDPVTGIQLDATWVSGYAKLTADSAGALAEGVKTMGAEPLADESFGELGRQLKTPQAYGKAAQLLRAQLGRAVEEYFAPVVGRWSDMHDEAERWRLVGQGVEGVTEALNRPLGKLDAAWDGEAADSFIAYMQQVRSSCSWRP